MDDDKKRQTNAFLKFSGLGLQMLVAIGLGAWIGMKLDQYFELKFPVFLLLFVFSIFGGMMFKLNQTLN